MQINSENSTPYLVDNDTRIIEQALAILKDRMTVRGDALTNPADVKSFLTLKISELEHEVFSCLFLDTKHCLIEYREIFRGTVNGASVYPREIVKEALACNAQAVIFAHNHPSGSTEPSQADKAITARLVSALELIDVRALDHFIVGQDNILSFAESGLM